MTKKTPAMPDIATAEQHASTANARVDELRAAILAGDTSINPGELETAEADARLANLRVEAAQKRASDAEEQTRLDKIQAIRREIEATINDPAQYLDALQALESAIRTWIELNEARVDQIRTWQKQLRELEVPGQKVNGRPEPHGIASHISPGSHRPKIFIDDGHVGAVDPTDYLTFLTWSNAAMVRNPSLRKKDIYTQLRGELGHTSGHPTQAE